MFSLGVTGQHRGVVIVFSERLAAITVRCVSESHTGEEMEGLTAEVFGGNFELVQKTGRSLKIVNPDFKRHWLSSESWYLCGSVSEGVSSPH